MEAVGRGVILFYSGYRLRTSLIIVMPQVLGSVRTFACGTVCVKQLGGLDDVEEIGDALLRSRVLMFQRT
jgi:hypothetical protein